MNSVMMDTTIIIPTLNEEHNIGRLVERLKKLYAVDVMITDDGSSDRTIEVAQHAGAQVTDRKNEKIKGLTAAVVHAALHIRTENCVVMDADFQHPPERVKEIINLLKNNSIVVAERQKIIGNWSVMRRLQSTIATGLAYIRIGKKVRDPLSGFFGIKTELLNSLEKERWELRCFKILFAVLKSCKGRDIKIASLNYDFDLRKRDESKIRLKHVYYFIRNVLT